MDLITMVLACSLYSDNSITNAMVQIGSQNNALMITLEGGKSKVFSSQSQAINYANSQLSQGSVIDIGLLQIPSRWLTHNNQVTVTDLLRPCKNMVIATQILNHAQDQCQQLQQKDTTITNLQACALSVYKSGNPQKGLDYANSVITYANAHSFDALEAAAKTKNPAEFEMLPGDTATTISTPNASKVNPSTDPIPANSNNIAAPADS